jgi:hypothetical protein
MFRFAAQNGAAIAYQSTEGAEFVRVSEYQKGEGCEILSQFVFI